MFSFISIKETWTAQFVLRDFNVPLSDTLKNNKSITIYKIELKIYFNCKIINSNFFKIK